MTTPKFKPDDVVYVRDANLSVDKAIVHTARMEIKRDGLHISYCVGFATISGSAEYPESVTFATPEEAFKDVPVLQVKRR